MRAAHLFGSLLNQIHIMDFTLVSVTSLKKKKGGTGSVRNEVSVADRLAVWILKVGNFGCSDFPDLGFLPPDSCISKSTVLLNWPQHFPLVLKDASRRKSSYLSPL